MWRGRLPHWRADNVIYYVTFRHRRQLEPHEASRVVYHILKHDSKSLDVIIACVLPETTELLFRVNSEKEFSDFIEKAKTKAGKEIIKKSGERFPPFFEESYDRIIRDDTEFEEFWTKILESPVAHELVEEPGDYEALYVPDAP
jgi:putative transposase